MQDRTPTVTPETAQALLAVLREVKDDFRDVDVAVTSLLRTRAARDLRVAMTMITGTVSQFTVGLLGGNYVADALNLPPGSDGSGGFVAGCMVAANVAGAAIYGFGTATMPRKEVVPDKTCDDFLFAGIAVELTLGDLRSALDDARRDRPGVADRLAATADAAREAFEQYVVTLKGLRKTQLNTAFPWPARDIDLTSIRESAEKTERVLAKFGPVAAGTPGVLLHQRVFTTTTPVGSMGGVISTAETLRRSLAAVSDTLAQVEETTRAAPRGAPDGALARLTELVAEARMRAILAETDCLAFETAAHLASAEDNAVDGLRQLSEAPATAGFRNAFEGYAMCLGAAATQAAAGLPSLPEVSSALRRTVADLAGQRTTMGLLTGAVDTALLGVAHVVTI